METLSCQSGYQNPICPNWEFPPWWVPIMPSIDTNEYAVFLDGLELKLEVKHTRGSILIVDTGLYALQCTPAFRWS